ncbi:quinolinate synthase NadA [Haloplasma contractile]|uniref:Quinolinate synthase n=1 Tax=Haloplasma contractile SSD-17B TaxID=1033810 RepID=U2FLS5_9MOLU|nr:quinolinate synthase NadA [Haloplasma contractile]ERJ13700.1 Quinolinate synthase A 2 protein [Haloplasma contractile SSD-17B]
MNKQQLVDEIKRLKEEKNAVILAHYYQRAGVQDVADYMGDSLKLSRIAAETDADMIVFCGVHFMAETAKILSPEKTVLLPVAEAGCPMADMVTERKLTAYKEKHPDTLVVCYVNTTAQVKALSDVCVTSSNAEKVIRHYEGEKLLYVPDKNLGTYLKHKYDLDMEVWPGFCCIHNDVTKEEVEFAKSTYPNAEFIVHPECRMEIVEMADFVGSTKGLLEYVSNSDCQEFIIGTEKGIIHQMELANKDKKFHLLSENLACYDMKLTNLEDVYEALKNEQHVIEVEETIREQALKSLNRMFELTDQ